MHTAYPTSIDDLLALMPIEAHAWIREGARAWTESGKSGVPIECPYADPSVKANFWHSGFIAAQFVRHNQEDIHMTDDHELPGSLTGTVGEIDEITELLGDRFNEIFFRAVNRIKTTIELELAEERVITITHNHRRDFYNER